MGLWWQRQQVTPTPCTPKSVLLSQYHTEKKMCVCVCVFIMQLYPLLLLCCKNSDHYRRSPRSHDGLWNRLSASQLLCGCVRFLDYDWSGGWKKKSCNATEWFQTSEKVSNNVFVCVDERCCRSSYCRSGVLQVMCGQHGKLHDRL